MQNEQPVGGFRRIDGFSAPNGSNTPSMESPQKVATSLSSVSPLSPSPASFSTTPSTTPPAPRAKAKKSTKTISRKLWFGIAGGIAAIALVAGGLFLAAQNNVRFAVPKASDFNTVSLPLGEFTLTNSAVGADSLQVNGTIRVTDSIILSPQDRPSNPVLGQLFFDRAVNQLTYYDGLNFITVGSNGGTTSTNVTNVSNAGDGGGGVNLQATSPGTPQIGNFNVSGTGTVGGLQVNGDTTIKSGSTSTLQVQNAAGQNMLSVDGAVGSVAVQGRGNGTVSMATDATNGSSGSISIRTGDSATTASGNISIDTGNSIIDGELIAHKTFETTNENMTPWFTTNINRTTAQAHTGQYSLAETGTAPNWGIIELLPGTPVVQGHQYYFSLWVRADSVPRSINASIAWVGASAPVSLSPIVDSTTEWKEITGVATAPAGATSAYFRIQGLAATNETHYFDDLTITDLSSSAAISAIDIGASNAKLVTIGNMNQIGATSIFGGSGITMNSGAGALTVNAGTMALSANAVSSISTTSGALTVTSADSATWGIATASNGNGGELTVKGGNGSAGGDNNGGDLILQGGNANANGTHGRVVVKPITDSNDVFQIQNTAGNTLFMADTSNMRIAITGSDTAFSNLSLVNAHFSTTQTTPPAISTPTNCGAGANATLATGAADSAGAFTITTGTGGTASTCDTTITFHQPYGAIPKSIIIAGKTSAISAARQPYVSAESPTSFTVSFGASAGGADSTAYSFNYWVVE